jgi:hypothetical protein
MIINSFVPFSGEHCETTATGTLLRHLGVELSEPMMFGLGEGLGFIYWDMKSMDFPFIGGRIKQGLLTNNLINNLGLELEIKETSSIKTAWKNVKDSIDAGIPVGLKLDSYYLDYFTNKVHFAGHFVAMYGYDDTYAYLSDTRQQGAEIRATLENLALARNSKGNMASKNLSYRIFTKDEKNNSLDIRPLILKSIKRNSEDFLNPAIKNVGYKGIEKTAVEIRNWFKRSRNIKDDLLLTSVLMEKAGTGGALFRNIYRDFLGECIELLKDRNIKAAYDMYCDIAPLWTEVSKLIKDAGETQDNQYLMKASDILNKLSKMEKTAMEKLYQVL